MNIHVCRRCDGCGHVAGGFHWEVPWTLWAPTARAAEDSFLEPHACPDCGGTGALIELPDVVRLNLPTRRTLRGEFSYSDHVASVLRNQTRSGRAPSR